MTRITIVKAVFVKAEGEWSTEGATGGYVEDLVVVGGGVDEDTRVEDEDFSPTEIN